MQRISDMCGQKFFLNRYLDILVLFLLLRSQFCNRVLSALTLLFTFFTILVELFRRALLCSRLNALIVPALYTLVCLIWQTIDSNKVIRVVVERVTMFVAIALIMRRQISVRFLVTCMPQTKSNNLGHRWFVEDETTAVSKKIKRY